eukprot:13762659-Heterocapsa_arctica.AAC.1
MDMVSLYSHSCLAVSCVLSKQCCLNNRLCSRHSSQVYRKGRTDDGNTPVLGGYAPGESHASLSD